MKSPLQAFLGGCLVFVTMGSASAASVSGQNGVSVSIYSNPFTGSTNTYGSIGGGTVVQQGGYPTSNTVAYIDSRASIGMGALQSSDATQGYMQFVPTSPFSAGTVIADQWLSNFYGTGGAPNNMAYTIKLNGTNVMTGSGTPGTHAIQVGTLSSSTSVSQMRVELNMAEFNGSGTRYANMNEVLVLPEQMQRISVSSITQSVGTTAGYPDVNALYDLSGAGAPDGASPDGGWVGSSGSVVTLNFSGSHTVKALVLAAWEDGGLAPTFNIKNDAGVIIANVTMNATDYTPISFDSMVTTTSLTFEFTSPDEGTPMTAALREIIALETIAVPEPGTATLAFAGVGVVFFLRLLRRRR